MKIKQLAYDKTFKHILLKHKNILAKLIGILIDEEVKDYNILSNVELLANNYNSRKSIIDIIAFINKKTIVNLEVNHREQKIILVRNVQQLCKSFAEIIPKNAKNKDLIDYNCFQINLNTFSNPNGKCIQKYEFEIMVDNKTKYVIMTIYNIDIVKCLKIIYNNGININKIDKKIRIGAMFMASTLEKVKDIISNDILSKNEKEELMREIQLTNSQIDFWRDWMMENLRIKEEDEYETAKEKAMEKGLKQGLKQGVKQGTEQTSISMITNMLKNKLDYSLISNISGKSISEIKHIEKTIC